MIQTNIFYIFFQDFECNIKLKNETIEFLEDIICTSSLLPSEHRASSQLLRMLTKEEPTQTPKINLGTLLTSLQVSEKKMISNLRPLLIVCSSS